MILHDHLGIHKVTIHWTPKSLSDKQMATRASVNSGLLLKRLRSLREWNSITKTCLYNFDPLKPHFYIVKLGFTGVYISFLISAQKIDCEYSYNLLIDAVQTSTHNLFEHISAQKHRLWFSKVYPY